MKPLTLTLALIPLVTLGCSTAQPQEEVTPPTTHDLTGTVLVGALPDHGSDFCNWVLYESVADRLMSLFEGQTYPCPDGPGGGYSDLKDGAQVKVTDGAGAILAMGKLTGGTATGDGVLFQFDVQDVPETDFLQVGVGGRDALSYPLAELESMDWAVALTIGS